jgi:RNA polymerase sigma-70 factor (ECF subfamily)
VTAVDFPVTRWSLILRARESDASRRAALEALITPRWRALYALARKRGLAKDSAEDAVQSFVERLLAGDAVERLDPTRGRLRSYLAAAFTRHLVNLHEHAVAAKRGAGRRAVDLDAVEALVASSADTPEQVFDRAFALAQYQAALADLRTEFEVGERRGPFEILESLFRFGETESYEVLAERHGMSVPQLKSLVHRAKRRFQQLFRARVAETVDDPSDIEQELSVTLSLLGAG